MSGHLGRSLTASNSSACRFRIRRLCRTSIGPLLAWWEPIFYRFIGICLPRLIEQASEIGQRLPGSVRSRRTEHPGADDLVEHPFRDLTVVPLGIIADLATKNVDAACLPTPYSDFLPVQRMPWVTDSSDRGLVITLVGTCTTDTGPTAPCRRRLPMRSTSCSRQDRERHASSRGDDGQEARPVPGLRQRCEGSAASGSRWT